MKSLRTKLIFTAIALIMLLVAVFAVMAIAVIPYVVMYNKNWDPEVGMRAIEAHKVSLLTVVTGGMISEIFGFLPALEIAHGGESGLLYSIAVYVFLICVVVALVYAVFAVLSFDKAAKRVRKALFVLGLGALIYALAFAMCLNVNIEAANAKPVAELTEGVIALGTYSLEKTATLVAVACFGLAAIVRACSNRIIKWEKKIKKTQAKINKAKGL